MSTLEKNEHRFKIGDTITVTLEGSWLKNEPGFVVSLDPLPWEKEEHSIVVNFPHIKEHRFNSHMNREVPQEQKKWVSFLPSEIVLGQKPKTQKEIIDALVDSDKIHSCCVLAEPKDHTCIVEGCNNFATEYGMYNVWGSAVVFKGCAWHLADYGNKWCDPDPFKTKTNDLIIPDWAKPEAEQAK